MRKFLLLVSAALLGISSPATAQVPLVDLDLTLRGGAYIPASDAYQVGAAAQQLLVERSTAFALGGAVELNIPLSPFDVRLNADYVTGSTLAEEGVAASSSSDAATLLFVGGDIVFRPLPRLLVVQPYTLAGLAYRHTSYDVTGWQNTRPEDLKKGDTVGHVGLGVDVMLGSFGVVAEVGDYIARTGGALEHDAFAQVGIKFRAF